MQLLILGFLTYGISTGHATVSSGDARVGGHKAFVNSEFALTQLLIFLTSLIYVFFVSVAAGMSMIRDDEAKVGELPGAERIDATAPPLDRRSPEPLGARP